MDGYIVETFHRLIEELEVTTHRYLYKAFQLKDRLIGLIGPRGVGKTTLLLQYIKEYLYAEGKAFYFSADLVYFKSENLLEFVADLYQNGGYRIVFIDEIHKYANWNQEIKNLYDSFPRLQIVFSGSSMLDLVYGSYDLSRRASLYSLRGMSFREYLQFNQKGHWDPLLGEDLFTGMSGKALQKLSHIEKLAPLFQEYLETGYYPFVAENPLSYYDKLRRIVDKTIYEDIANCYKLNSSYLHFFKQILHYLTTIPPGKVNTHSLAKHLKIDVKTVGHYLQILHEVGLVRLLYPVEGGGIGIRKPAKVFLHNTTLLHAICQYGGGEKNKGTERELFFFQSLMDADIPVFFSKVGDFFAKDTIFEIGGRNKTAKQLKKATHPAYLVKDSLRSPYGNEIPLHYFGFLY